MATTIGQYTSVFLPRELPSPIEKPDRPQSTGSQRVGHNRSDPPCIDARLFLPVADLPQREWSVNVAQMLGSWATSGAKRAGTQTASTAGVMAPAKFVFEPLVAGDQKASLALVSL